MSSPLFAAMARMSRFYCFVTFLIGFSFMGFGRASGDRANDFRVVFLIERMDHPSNQTRSHGANRYRAFRIVQGGIALRHRAGIVENENGSFKANIMFTEVLPALVLIPLQSHSWSRPKTANRPKPRVSIRLYVHFHIVRARIFDC
jgi:hypothetical protein